MKKDEIKKKLAELCGKEFPHMIGETSSVDLGIREVEFLTEAEEDWEFNDIVQYVKVCALNKVKKEFEWEYGLPEDNVAQVL